ncbi:hypothetical protein [Candidatus Nitrospira neomarina]|uniref:Uncharacterized protein n=1 Tax=Candidatus Nitrospira neomarina TaxID=3020899 RepID=A0AA96K2S4_9BACT|nr:hypothetical protein [Candidatus Nitrospira neomarina]WNM61874.1 hypothetical protein PQG83_19345 [Candidatus Nitrospira neomarina]
MDVKYLRPRRLTFLFHQSGEQSQQIHVVYRSFGYWLTDIADHFGVQTTTVRRRLKWGKRLT